MHGLNFDVAHLLAGGLVLVSFMLMMYVILDGFDLGAGIGGRKRQRALEDAAERLRLADRDVELAVPQIERDGGASEPRALHGDAGRRIRRQDGLTKRASES